MIAPTSPTRRRHVLAPLAVALGLCLSAPAAALQGAKKPARPPSDRAVTKAWRKLGPDGRQEIVDWFSAEVEFLDTFQMRLIRFALEDPERPPLLWPERESSRTYDAATHAPSQPIERKWLPEGSRVLKRFRVRVFKKIPERRLDSAWEYDYATRELRRVPGKSLDDVERIFQNALAGFPPNLDMAEALVERALDDGAQRRVLEAFAHAYTDRDGRAFRGVSLYDAWCSGFEMEMPDVDTLGVIHEVLDDWSTWKAPVRKQASLYDRIGELFADARRHRGLRHALARSYLTGDVVLRDNYQLNLDRLHALWDMNSSEPKTLAKRLPAAEDWEDWLDQTFSRINKDEALWAAGLGRRATLVADAARVRATLARVMREYGALR